MNFFCALLCGTFLKPCNLLYERPGLDSKLEFCWFSLVRCNPDRELKVSLKVRSHLKSTQGTLDRVPCVSYLLFKEWAYQFEKDLRTSLQYPLEIMRTHSTRGYSERLYKFTQWLRQKTRVELVFLSEV